MEFIITNSYEELSEACAKRIAEQIKSQPKSVLGLATGSTPIGTYKNLVTAYNEGEISFKDIVTFNLDEYVGLVGTHHQSYRYFMNEHLFNHVDIDLTHTHVPSGVSKDTDKECIAYESMIEQAGGIDLQLLGLGHNGHIGFNEPDEVFSRITHGVDLDERTIQANSRLFNSIDEVPRQAVTMGIGTIMKARQVIVIASGADKADIVERAFTGEVTPQVPASILQFHPHVTIILDSESASKLPSSVRN